MQNRTYTLQQWFNKLTSLLVAKQLVFNYSVVQYRHSCSFIHSFYLYFMLRETDVFCKYESSQFLYCCKKNVKVPIFKFSLCGALYQNVAMIYIQLYARVPLRTDHIAANPLIHTLRFSLCATVLQIETCSFNTLPAE